LTIDTGRTGKPSGPLVSFLGEGSAWREFRNRSGSRGLKLNTRLDIKGKPGKVEATMRSNHLNGGALALLGLTVWLAGVSQTRACFQCTSAPTGLVAWWRGAGNALDDAGSNAGVAVGGLTYGQGAVGEGFVFNGTNAGVTIPASPQLDVGTGGGFTIEAWIDPAGFDSTSATSRCIFSWYLDSEPSPGPLLQITRDMQLQANIVELYGWEHRITSAAGLVKSNSNQHVALTYNGTNGLAILYLNAAEVARETVGVFQPRTSRDVHLGARGWSSPDGYWAGVLDEVSLYNRALSGTEIYNLFSAHEEGKCPALCRPALWPPLSNVFALAGNTITLGADVRGGAPLFYQWFKDQTALTNGNELSGAQASALVLSNVSWQTAGSYWLLATNLYGSLTTSVAVVTVGDPAISASPQAAALDVGQSTNLTVAAVSSQPISYQWRLNGVPLAGRTTDTLELPEVRAADAGGYDVVVSNELGCATSAVAIVTVNLATLDSYRSLDGPAIMGLGLQSNWTTVATFWESFDQGNSDYPAVCRFGETGLLDTSYRLYTDGTLDRLLVREDGRILAGGSFQMACNRWVKDLMLIQTDANGNLDTNFNLTTFDHAAPVWVSAIGQQPDGRILVAAYAYDTNQQTFCSLRRLNADLSTDATFAPVASQPITCLAVQPDGKIVIGGGFTNVNGLTRSHLARLNANGLLDTTFAASVPSAVECLLLQPDGRILAAGAPINANGQEFRGLVRFLRDGSVDAAFATSGWTNITSLCLQANGKVLVAGWPQNRPAQYYYSGMLRSPLNLVRRINTDGSDDLNVSVEPDAEMKIAGLALRPDGKVLVGGFFHYLDGQSRPGLGRLNNPDANRRTLIASGSTVLWQLSGSCPQPSWVTFQTSSDGTNWVQLGQGRSLSGGWQLANAAIPLRTYVRAQGLVSSGYYNGSSWFMQDTVATAAAERPRLTIGSPGPGQRCLTNAWTAAGSASSPAGVAGVWYQLNGGDWAQAQGAGRWTAELMPLPGTNTLKAFAVDSNGAASAPASVLFTRVQLASLTVLTNGLGTVSPNYSGKSLELGRTYSLTAKPGSGQIFAGWSGSLSGSAATLSFVMESNLVLQASFTTNPYPALAGRYLGLFSDSLGVASESSGEFQLSVTRTGTFSGTVQLGRSRYAASGRLDRTGAAVCTVARARQTTLSLSLQLDMTGGAGALAGTLSDGSWTASLTGDRAQSGPASQAGRYTLMVTGRFEPVSEPCGHGYGTALVSRSGQVSLAGVLADGSPVTRSAAITQNGQCPLFVPLYSGEGLLLSWLSFSNSLAGEADWIRPSLPTAGYFTNGFAVQTRIWGMKYVPPGKGSNVLEFSTGELWLKAAGSSLLSTQAVALNAAGRLTFPTNTSGRSGITVTASTGLFKGTALDPQSGKTVAVQGAVLQSWNIGCGFFLNPLENGGVLFGPATQLATNIPGWKP
jgi:uncharacterized delta-60 repeat protein